MLGDEVLQILQDSLLEIEDEEEFKERMEQLPPTENILMVK
jgi:hypothetical protein